MSTTVQRGNIFLNLILPCESILSHSLICTCVLNSIYDSNICVRDSSKSLLVNSIILLHWEDGAVDHLSVAPTNLWQGGGTCQTRKIYRL